MVLTMIDQSMQARHPRVPNVVIRLIQHWFILDPRMAGILTYPPVKVMSIKGDRLSKIAITD